MRKTLIAGITATALAAFIGGFFYHGEAEAQIERRLDHQTVINQLRFAIKNPYNLRAMEINGPVEAEYEDYRAYCLRFREQNQFGGYGDRDYEMISIDTEEVSFAIDLVEPRFLFENCMLRREGWSRFDAYYRSKYID